MNDIEKMFYDAWMEYCEWMKRRRIIPPPIHAQVPCGGYIVDFIIDYPFPTKTKIAIEIDGHETHKTKAQRINDYARERFLMTKNMIVIRFTASEIYVDARACVNEVAKIAYEFERVIDVYANDLYREAVQLGEDLEAGRVGRRHRPF